MTKKACISGTFISYSVGISDFKNGFDENIRPISKNKATLFINLAK
ncbi:hypothetical protein [Pseudoalteromonas prydzensis]|nr:hypothetical protein [Pseudoalteromonas prydzensis]MBE0377166.1 hypothetical protein [Pseudoalteromonas prydzensis ACAM 620]